MNDVSVYLGRQRGGGIPDRKGIFRTHVLRFEPRAVRFLHKRSKLQRKIRHLARSSTGDPSPPLLSTEVDTDVIHMINDTRPSPSVFACCKRSKTGRLEGLGTGLYLDYMCT